MPIMRNPPKALEELLEVEETQPSVIQQAFKGWLEIFDEVRAKQLAEEEMDKIYQDRISRWMLRKGRE